MEPLRRLIDFYRVQAELIWNWRRGRRHLISRAVVSFFVAAFALALTAFLLPGVRVDSVVSLALAVVVIGALGALVRPILLALVAPLSLTLMLITALVFQVVVFLALEPFVPGYHLAAPIDALFAAIVFAVINSTLSWLLSLDTDDSYYSMLVRRLLVRRRDAIHSKKPGFVFVQIDGLSHPVLQQQLQAGRVPIMSRWVNLGRMRLASWTTLLPSQTSASQAGILFGNNDDIPAFRWYDKAAHTMFVSNRAADAEALEQRLIEAGHSGLLSGDGASIGNLCSGGATRSYLTLSTLNDPGKGLGTSRSYFSFFLSPYGFVHAIVLGIAEMAKELFQARRARLAGVAPRLDTRGFPYPVLRAMTNVVMRPLVTSLVIEEMLRGTPRDLRHLYRLRRDRPSQRPCPGGEPRGARRRGSRAGRPCPGRGGRSAAVPLRDPVGPRPDPGRHVPAALRQVLGRHHQAADGRCGRGRGCGRRDRAVARGEHLRKRADPGARRRARHSQRAAAARSASRAARGTCPAGGR